jgi:hypothetical protein
MKKYAPHLAILSGLLLVVTWQGLRAGIIQAIIPQAVPTGYYVGGQAKFATTDSSGNITTPGGISTGQGSSTTGYVEPKGKTSGGMGFTVADAAGGPVLYVLPTAVGGSGKVLTDNGSTSCPSLPSGAPSTCEALTWGSGGGGGGGGTANPSCTFAGSATGCATPATINVSAFSASTVDQFLVQCFTGASTTQTPVSITDYVYTTSAGIIQTIAPVFSSAAAAGYCVVNGTGTGGGSSTFPLTVVQESAFSSGSSNVNSYAVTFPQTTAASGNTAFILLACDGSASVGTPAGWTVDINQTEATYARFILVHKATAADTSATFTTSSSNMAGYFFEVTGSHALDQSSLGGVANRQTVVLPAITPTAGSVVFGVAGIVVVSGFAYNNPGTISPLWRPIAAAAPVSGGGRALVGNVSVVSAANTATTPPAISMPDVSLFGGGGIAYASFSIL